DSSLDGGLDDSVIIVAEDTNGTTIFDIDDEMDLGDGFSKISKFDR
ncbi:7087_t:CDS:1, partial [Paraglomus brasilianum]